MTGCSQVPRQIIANARRIVEGARRPGFESSTFSTGWYTCSVAITKSGFFFSAAQRCHQHRGGSHELQRTDRGSSSSSYVLRNTARHHQPSSRHNRFGVDPDAQTKNCGHADGTAITPFCSARRNMEARYTTQTLFLIVRRPCSMPARTAAVPLRSAESDCRHYDRKGVHLHQPRR